MRNQVQLYEMEIIKDEVNASLFRRSSASIYYTQFFLVFAANQISIRYDP